MQDNDLPRRFAVRALRVAGDHGGCDGLAVEEAPIFGLRLGDSFLSVFETDGGILLGRAGSPLRIPVVGPANEHDVDVAARCAIEYLSRTQAAHS